MKIKAIIITIMLMLLCYFTAALFFLNSGIIDDQGSLDEIRSIKILQELDKIPLVNTDVEDITFSTYGTVKSITSESITISAHHHKIETFSHNGNLSILQEGDTAWISYGYSTEFEKEIIQFRKVLQVKDVVDYATCREYGGRLNYDFPRECVIGQVTFDETIEELQQVCASYNGIWIEDHDECEMITRRDCRKMDGDYHECESACRHDSESEACVMMCVQVCKME